MKKILLIICCFSTLTILGQGQVTEWAAPIGGAGVDDGKGITSDAWGNVYVTGYFQETVDFDPNPELNNIIAADSSDIFISKFSADGQFIWAVTFGDFDIDWGAGIDIDTLGNVYVAGFFKGTVDFDPGLGIYDLSSASPDGYDIFVLKLDTDGQFIWARNMGGPGDDAGRAIAVDPGGNVFVTGRFQENADLDPGSGIFNLSSNGDTDIFIAKLNQDGDFVWARSIGGVSSDQGNAIALDDANNVYSIGFFREDVVDFDPGPDTFNLTAIDGSDIYIVKLNQDGGFVWAQKIGGAESQRGHGITTDNNNNVYTTGYYRGTVDFDPGPGIDTLTPEGNRDIFILKLDSDGDYIWARSFGDEEIDKGFAMAVDQFNNVYTTGEFEGTVDFDPGPGTFNLTAAGNRDIYILKLDEDGSFVWVESFSGNGEDDAGFAINVDVWNNIYTTGFFQETIDFDSGTEVFELTSNGGHDGFIHKMNNCVIPTNITSDFGFQICQGEILNLNAGVGETFLWNTGNSSSSITVSPQASTSYSVSVLDDQGCYGTSTVQISVTPPPYAQFDYTSNGPIVEFNNLSDTSDTQFQWNFGDSTYSADVNPIHNYNQPGRYLVTLFATNPQCGSAISQYVDVLSTGDLIFGDDLKFELYPNPTNDVLYIKSETPIDQIQIYNVFGQRVLESNDKNDLDMLDVRHLTPGVYLISFMVDDRVLITQFVKM